MSGPKNTRVLSSNSSTVEHVSLLSLTLAAGVPGLLRTSNSSRVSRWHLRNRSHSVAAPCCSRGISAANIFDASVHCVGCKNVVAPCRNCLPHAPIPSPGQLYPCQISALLQLLEIFISRRHRRSLPLPPPQVFKPFRLLKAVETITPGNDAVVEQTAKTMAYFVSTLFLASGLVQVNREIIAATYFSPALGELPQPFRQKISGSCALQR